VLIPPVEAGSCLPQKILVRRPSSLATLHQFALEPRGPVGSLLLFPLLYSPPPTTRGHALLVLPQGQTHPRSNPSSSPRPSPSPPSPIDLLRPLENMGSLASERTVVGWAARDATGHLSPYTYTVRYAPAGRPRPSRPSSFDPFLLELRS